MVKADGASHGQDPWHWTLATGPLIDLTTIAEQFGLTFTREPDGGIGHNLRAAVIDASGRVRTIFIGNKWTSDELAAEMVKGASKPK